MIVDPLFRREVVSAVAIASAVHFAIAATAIGVGVTGTYAWGDQVNYHMPAIEKFAAELPYPALRDYQSATAPGYHLLVAALLRLGLEGAALHLFNALFGVAFVALFTFLIARRSGGLVGLIAGVALALSPYTVNPSVFIATDNVAASLVLVAFTFGIAIATGSAMRPVQRGALAALASTIVVGVRQVMAYSAAFPGAAVVARAFAERRRPRLGALLAAAAVLVPAFVVLGMLIELWGGLVPPSFQKYHGSGANAATPVYAMALVSIWGCAAFTAIPGFLRELLSVRVLAVGVLAAVACCAVPSSFVKDVRFGGTLWTLASKFPSIADRSVLLVPLAGIGTAALYAYVRLWQRSTDRNPRGLGLYTLFAFLGMVLAQTANSQCFERYMQPLTFAFMAVAASALAGRAMRIWPYAVAAAVSAVWCALMLAQRGA